MAIKKKVAQDDDYGFQQIDVLDVEMKIKSNHIVLETKNVIVVIFCFMPGFTVPGQVKDGRRGGFGC